MVAATLVDRLTLFLSTLLFASLMAVLQARDRVPPGITRSVYMVTGTALLLLALALHPAVRNWLRRQMLPRLPQRFRETVAEVSAATLAFRNEPEVLAGSAGVTLALFGVRLGFAKAVALSCGADLSFGDLLLVVPVLWVVVMIPITIGSIGVQDAGYVVLMGLLGIAAPVAASMSLVEHAVSRAASLPGAVFVGEFSRKTPHRRDAAERSAPGEDRP